MDIAVRDKIIEQLKPDVDQDDEGARTKRGLAPSAVALEGLAAYFQDVERQKEEQRKVDHLLQTHVREQNETRASFISELNAQREQHEAQHHRMHLRFKWKTAILQVMLHTKRSSGRRMRARSQALEWLERKSSRESSSQLKLMSLELQTSQKRLVAQEAESAELKTRAEQLAGAHTSLANHQHQLVHTTLDAMERERQLSGAFEAADKRASRAAQQREELATATLQLRWQLRQAKDEVVAKDLGPAPP